MNIRAIFIPALIFAVSCGAEPDANGERAASADDAFRSAGAQNPALPEHENAHDRVVVAADIRAAEAGMEMLRRGGSAVDAAVAVQAVLGLVEPQSSGLGGGAFMLRWDAGTKNLTTFDGREFAPAAAGPDLFLKEDGTPMGFYDAVVGGRSVGVPGAVAMLGEAHARYGKIPWADLFDPARKLAEEGFIISPRLAGLIATVPRLKQEPAAAAYFYNEDGTPKPEGTLLKNPAYARTLQIIAEGGPEAFYEGEIAEAIVAAVTGADNPGAMTLEDLAAYAPVERAPVCGRYRVYQVCSMTPPSSGGATLLNILAILENFDLSQYGPTDPEGWKLIMEASRLAYADRALYLADPDKQSGEGAASNAIVDGMASAAYGADRATLLSLEAAMESAPAGRPAEFAGGVTPERGADESPEPPSTSHFSIQDADGNVISMTTTVEFAFGSHTMAAGFILNNQLTDFSFLPVKDGKPVANAVGPRKRPRSSMSPVIVFDGETGAPVAAFGSPGGPAIIGYVAKTLIAWADWGLPLQGAIDAPNIVVPRGGVLAEEGATPPETVAALESYGYAVTTRSLTSGVNGFVLGTDGAQWGADKRREGAGLVEGGE